MTETDASKRPLEMPPRFIPYLEKYRIYKIFKDMVRDLIINLPKDHLLHMKIFLTNRLQSSREPDRVMMLISPELKIDVKALAQQLIKDLGFFVITRRCVMDRYEKHDDYEPGKYSPELMSEVTRTMTKKDPVPQAGWLMFDHPCTVREARCLQQDGVLPTVTLALAPAPPPAPPAPNPLTPERHFSQQHFEGLQYAYKATLKVVLMEPEDDVEKLATRCFNAVRACAAGAQGPLQGCHAVGAPGTYRVLLLGPRGSGRHSQGVTLAKHFGLVYISFDELMEEAKLKYDEVGDRLRRYGPSLQLRAEVLRRRLLKKDCIDHGWVLTGYPNSGSDFECLDKSSTEPNRVIFLNADWATCKERLTRVGVDWCSGAPAPLGSGARVKIPPRNTDENLDAELDLYFSETLAELRAAAGITAVEIDASEPVDKVQIKLQAAVISAPAFDIEFCSTILHAIGD